MPEIFDSTVSLPRAHGQKQCMSSLFLRVFDKRKLGELITGLVAVQVVCRVGRHWLWDLLVMKEHSVTESFLGFFESHLKVYRPQNSLPFSTCLCMRWGQDVCNMWDETIIVIHHAQKPGSGSGRIPWVVTQCPRKLSLEAPKMALLMISPLEESSWKSCWRRSWCSSRCCWPQECHQCRQKLMESFGGCHPWGTGMPRCSPEVLQVKLHILFGASNIYFVWSESPFICGPD